LDEGLLRFVMEELINVDFFEEAPTSCSGCNMAVILTELKYKMR
jgi:hypothetical protein